MPLAVGSLTLPPPSVVVATYPHHQALTTPSTLTLPPRPVAVHSDTLLPSQMTIENGLVRYYYYYYFALEVKM